MIDGATDYLAQYTQYAEGDRAKKQFGPEFGDRALEGALLTPALGLRRFAQAGICQLMLGEILGERGNEFMRWGLEDLVAYGRWAYNAEDNTFSALLTDGTILTPPDVKRKGYFGPVSSPQFNPAKAGGVFFRAYAMAFRISGDPFLWQMTRDIGRGNDLGDIGEGADGPPQLNMTTACSDPQVVYGLLELTGRTGRQTYLELARRIADNIARHRFRNGLFVNHMNQRFAKFDTDEPLALLHLVARTRGATVSVPAAWPGKSYFHCPYEGIGRTYDNEAIYATMETSNE